MPGGWRVGKAPLTAWVTSARASVGKYHSGMIQGSGSGCASPASHRHPESGGAAGTMPVYRKWSAPLSRCRCGVTARLKPSAAGATGRPLWALRQGKSWSAGQAWRSRAISSAVPVGVFSGTRCHMTAKGKATPVEGCTPGWSTAGARAARGMRGAPLGPCPLPGLALSPCASRQFPQPVRRGGPGCATPPSSGLCGRPGRRPP